MRDLPPIRYVSRVDELTISRRRFLAPGDVCFFLHQRWSEERRGPVASLIVNLKHPPSKVREKPAVAAYKKKAIAYCIKEFSAINFDTPPNERLFVPIPPSKAHHDPEYDDRMCQVAQAVAARTKANFQELLTNRDSLPPSHLSKGSRPTPDELRANYVVSAPNLIPNLVILIDDVMTEGSHFAASKARVAEVLPGVQVVGLVAALWDWS